MKDDKVTLLFCLIHAFVLALPDRDKYQLGNSHVSMIDMDDHLRFIEITFEVNDEIYLVPDIDGEIVIDRTAYTLGDYTIGVAESATVNYV